MVAVGGERCTSVLVIAREADNKCQLENEKKRNWVGLLEIKHLQKKKKKKVKKEGEVKF